MAAAATAAVCSFDKLLRPIPALRLYSQCQVRGGAPTVRCVLLPAAPGRGTRRRPVRRTLRSSGSVPDAPSDEGGGIDVDGLVEFLQEDLQHLFDDQGIDRTVYDQRVEFRDPITKHDTIGGYLFNIALLKILFRPQFQLHRIKQTGPLEITYRWTMVMRFALLPWKPEVNFTGVSVLGINPRTRKICSHTDLWDSISNNEYFSLEGLSDFAKQLRYYKTPPLDSPKYEILKRTPNYEVRRYSPFLVVEAKGDKLSGSSGFNDVTGYIFGKNTSSEKIPMTTPVFTQAVDNQLSKVSIQVVLPLDKELDKLPDPIAAGSVDLRKVEGGFAAVSKFSGRPTEEAVRRKERALRSSLLGDGLRPQEGCLLARYNDPRTKSFVMRNEVLIWLTDFELE